MYYVLLHHVAYVVVGVKTLMVTATGTDRYVVDVSAKVMLICAISVTLNMVCAPH